MELVTSRFLHGDVPPAEGYRVREFFYRRTSARGLGAPGRRPLKAAEHLADMLLPPTRRGRAGRDADVVHYQWLTVPALDVHLLPPTRPRVMTAHYILPPTLAAASWPPPAASSARMDAVVAHSEHGAARLRDELGLDPAASASSPMAPSTT